MLKTNDFILLRMIFNQDLYNAVMSKDKEKIEHIIKTRYDDEYYDPSFVQHEPIDVEYVYNQHLEDDKWERESGSNYQWAL